MLIVLSSELKNIPKSHDLLINKNKCAFVWNVFIVGVITGGFSFFYSTNSGERSGGNLLYQMLMLLLIGPGVFLYLANNMKNVVNVITRNWPFFLLLGWVIVSALWSVETFTSLRRSISLTLCIIYALHLTTQYSAQGLFRLFYYAVILILVGTLISVLIGIGVHANDEHAGALKGFAGHKNTLGRFLAVGSILAYAKLVLDKNIFSIGVFAIFLLALLATGSKTALAMSIAAIFSYSLFGYLATGNFPFSRFKHAFSTRLTFTWGVIVLGIVSTLSLFAILVEFFGRDLTFSGRNKIWNYALNVETRSDLFGAGFRSFWVDFHTWDFFVFNPYWGGGKVTANGHSGYLDIFLELGLVGFIIFLVFLVSYIKRVFSHREDTNHVNTFARISGPVLVFSLLYNIFETSFLTPRMELLWFLFVVVYIYLGKKNREC